MYDSSPFRTNNHIEGWHNRLNKIVGKAHPNIYELVETFKKEQASVEVAVTQLSSESGLFDKIGTHKSETEKSKN